MYCGYGVLSDKMLLESPIEKPPGCLVVQEPSRLSGFEAPLAPVTGLVGTSTGASPGQELADVVCIDALNLWWPLFVMSEF
jgi:hypothetical protein